MPYVTREYWGVSPKLVGFPILWQKNMGKMTGWWLTYPSEKYEFVSWDDYSQYMEKMKNVPNHQPDDD